MSNQYKFKKGDKVKFKSQHSVNAKYFVAGLENLTILIPIISAPTRNTYVVGEADSVGCWSVFENELTLQTTRRTKPKKTSMYYHIIDNKTKEALSVNITDIVIAKTEHSYYLLSNPEAIIAYTQSML